MGRGPACPGSRSHRGDSGPPGWYPAEDLERLLPGPGSLPGGRGTTRPGGDRADGPDRGAAAVPCRDGAGGAPRLARGASGHSAAGGRQRCGGRADGAGVLRPPRRRRGHGPPAAQHDQPGWGDWVRGRPARSHCERRRRDHLVRRREARRRPNPAQAARPLDHRHRRRRGAGNVADGGARRAPEDGDRRGGSGGG